MTDPDARYKVLETELNKLLLHLSHIREERVEDDPLNSSQNVLCVGQRVVKVFEV